MAAICSAVLVNLFAEGYIPGRNQRVQLKRFWLILIAFAVIPAGWIVISFASGPREPSYKGRRLSQWIGPYTANMGQDLTRDTPERIKLRAEATEAVQAIGTNAIPILLAWLKAKDPKTPPIRIVVMNWIDKVRGRPTGPYYPGLWKRCLAKYGFELLGTNAQSAVPALIQLGYDTNYEQPEFIWLCLYRFDTNAADKMMDYRISLEEMAKRLSATNSSVKK